MTFRRLAEDDLARRLMFNLRLPPFDHRPVAGYVTFSGGQCFPDDLFQPAGRTWIFGGFAGGCLWGRLEHHRSGQFGSGHANFAALVFAFIGLGSSYLLAQRIRFGGWVLRLVLSGIVISALFSSGLGVLKYIADPLSQLPEITFWLLGSLAHVTWPDVQHHPHSRSCWACSSSIACAGG